MLMKKISIHKIMNNRQKDKKTYFQMLKILVNLRIKR